MRIMMLADTHKHMLEQLPRKVIGTISTVDLIIHAGDFTDVQLLKELKKLGDAKAVHGNMDSTELKIILPAGEIMEIESRRIGITHGSGAPWGIENRVNKMFESNQFDIIVYGHSHRFQGKVIDGILVFNAGKAAESSGILTIDGEVKGEISNSRL